MKTTKLITAFLILISLNSFAQSGWTTCNTTVFSNRVGDIFMVNTQTGYAVSGNGSIVKTTDGGSNWATINVDTSIYCRSVEFINTQKGFVGAFPQSITTHNILRKTMDGGASWTDITPLLDTRARKGICGLCIPDSNTIYGCGNWYQDSAYIVKSADGGNTWSFIDMHMYASHLIDFYFLNKDTGFVTGTGLLPAQSAVILYTTDGGLTWAYKYQNTVSSEYCWKIQHFNNRIYFASIEDDATSICQILKSTDGGMTWNTHTVYPTSTIGSGLQGIGFIDSLKGWTGGGTLSFESNDGGITWDTNHVCIGMNRLYKVNDTLLFASGNEIWKYRPLSTGIGSTPNEVPHYITLNCFPNPANDLLTIDVTLAKPTHALIVLLDNTGKRVKVVDNTDKPSGTYQYQISTDKLSQGIYHVVIKTHQDQQSAKVSVKH